MWSAEQSIAKDVIVAERALESFQTCLKPSGSKRVLHDGTLKLVAMLCAVLNEPACVWMRGGSLRGVETAIEALECCINANDLSEDASNYIREEQLQATTLLFEWTKVAIGAVTGGSSTFSESVRDLLRCIMSRSTAYEEILYRKNAKSKQSTTIDPQEFDNTWLSQQCDAFHSAVDEGSPEPNHYNEFTKSWVWARIYLLFDHPHTRMTFH